ncbi:MAG: class I SAM-dependent methyltransferase [Magnetospirillum sp.]|nr:class I SAM-dependent methyltransferase [Magnetospirillum sp.]
MAQAEHYDSIINDYERHYFDPAAMEYRRRYIYGPLFDGIDLNGKSVAELACGSGQNTKEVRSLFPHADIVGLDISPNACAAYRNNSGCDAHVVDLTDLSASLPSPSDAAFVIGGLHHCVNNLQAAIENISRLVKPGGVLLMVEPNADFFLNAVRDFWYKKDKWFSENEEAPLHHDAIAKMAGPFFEPEKVAYLGGPAYFIVLNSLITRVPIGIKQRIAAPLFQLDDLYNRLPGRAPFPMFIARWRRR